MCVEMVLKYACETRIKIKCRTSGLQSQRSLTATRKPMENYTCSFLAWMSTWISRWRQQGWRWHPNNFPHLVEVRDSPHGILGSCAWCSKGPTNWREFLGNRRRRRPLEIQIDIQARKLHLEVFLWFVGRGERSPRMEAGVQLRILLRVSSA